MSRRVESPKNRGDGGDRRRELRCGGEGRSVPRRYSPVRVGEIPRVDGTTVNHGRCAAEQAARSPDSGSPRRRRWRRMAAYLTSRRPCRPRRRARARARTLPRRPRPGARRRRRRDPGSRAVVALTTPEPTAPELAQRITGAGRRRRGHRHRHPGSPCSPTTSAGPAAASSSATRTPPPAARTPTATPRGRAIPFAEPGSAARVLLMRVRQGRGRQSPRSAPTSPSPSRLGAAAPPSSTPTCGGFSIPARSASTSRPR